MGESRYRLVIQRPQTIRSTTTNWIPRRSSKHTFEDVLFTDETETPVNVLTGETPGDVQAIVEEAKEFPASIITETPKISLAPSVESQIEKMSKPYTAAAFLHFKPTDSLERHRTYHAAYEADPFAVDSEAD